MQGGGGALKCSFLLKCHFEKTTPHYDRETCFFGGQLLVSSITKNNPVKEIPGCLRVYEYVKIQYNITGRGSIKSFLQSK